MRKCLRCGAEMEEGFKLSGGFGNVVRRHGKAAYPKAAVCPECGEVAIYLDEKHTEKLTAK